MSRFSRAPLRRPLSAGVRLVQTELKDGLDAMPDDEVIITRHGVPVATIKPVVREDAKQAARNNRRCSFCEKTEDEIAHLILGITKFVDGSGTEQQVAICDECIDLCNDIIAEHAGKTRK